MTTIKVAARYLFDTNILLRLTQRQDPMHALIERSIRPLLEQSAALCYCPQNVVEFWNVLTRPTDRNGFGLSISQAEKEVRTYRARLHSSAG